MNQNCYSYVLLFPHSMPRSGGIRRYLREIAESPRAEKIAFIPPVLILLIEGVLLLHALDIKEGYVIFLTSFLLVVSIIELFLILSEMHEHRKQTTFERELAIRLDDFIIEHHMNNVSAVVEDFINEFEEYAGNRTMIYHIACQVIQTHKQELWEKTLRTRLKRHMEKAKDESMRDIIDGFMKKYPDYRNDPGKVYQLTAIYIEKRQSK